ncbi:MAG: pilus assembly PilX N-terminal domain-containing protein [Planctomycetes bacterium]|nr:pilus assembly PilX N-terminal domain-containing protein [Planctomycetota bacterium]
MRVKTKKTSKKTRGSALIIAMAFVTIFSTLAVSMLSMSSSNVNIADNHQKSGRAFESAQSGLEVMRYYMSQVDMPGATPASGRFAVLANSVYASMTSAGLEVTMTLDGGGDPIALSTGDIVLNSTSSQTFAATLSKTVDLDVVEMDIAGSAGTLDRNLGVRFTFDMREDSVFDYGVATKGPLHISGNIEMDGTNVAVEASVYIESNSDENALSIIGNSSIAGDVSITNPDGTVTLQGGQASIGGEVGQDAIDNHVFTGVPPTEFPLPNTSHFEQYVGDQVIDIDTDISGDATYHNVRIAAGTNPVFTDDVTLEGIVFIESPNVVTFTGSTNITGIIVGDGDVTDNSGTNQLTFLGNVSSASVTDLPDEDHFDAMRDETGTFVMAPGFNVSFGGNFGTLNGAIAANGIQFFGNAGGTIGGSVLNYSDTPMTLSGNSDLFFNRSGTTPAGFEEVPEIILHYDATSYNETVG